MMDRTTGRRIDPGAHLRQSVQDILTTPIGSRVMRRGYGSLLPALIDQPGNDATAARVASAAASALMKWEPRLSLVRVTLQRAQDADGATQPGAAIVNINATVAALAGASRPIAMAVEIGGGA